MSTVDEFNVADIRNGMTLDEAIEIAAHPSAKAATYSRKNEALKLLALAARRLLVLRPGWPDSDNGDFPGYPPAIPPEGGWPQRVFVPDTKVK